MALTKVAAVLLVIVVLQPPPSGTSSRVLMTKNITTDVMLFAEVWNRSYCRPIETLVDILNEFPHEAEYVFKPSCVSLQRCGGCCGDERLYCVPVETHVVVMQVVRVSLVQEKTREEAVSFIEHRSCMCRPKRKRLKVQLRPKSLHLKDSTEKAEDVPDLSPIPSAVGWQLSQHRASGCKQIKHRCKKPRHKGRKN
ncbi:snake venom vascular endothelial growth factor toxin apiscin [Microcaecilia unicolor]|uniref:Snake venom vascular endothelial growth factor toxin apiscin-like n=1 Tax=Microcaecilia unicolor TaxID=1415580 RepID=A0A6P7Z8K9_9AMPH|nr:snake venom vascular endothelial growth factor toxin apiscin-like [Microcaecilia unicolor]XP_030075692.1 snake venom vascular endothelial growth factor toxin apiscin-like [Microcaecilia unicolor]